MDDLTVGDQVVQADSGKAAALSSVFFPQLAERWPLPFVTYGKEALSVIFR